MAKVIKGLLLFREETSPTWDEAPIEDNPRDGPCSCVTFDSSQMIKKRCLVSYQRGTHTTIIWQHRWSTNGRVSRPPPKMKMDFLNYCL